MSKKEFLDMLLNYIPSFKEWKKKEHPNDLPKETNDLFGGNYSDIFKQIMD